MKSFKPIIVSLLIFLVGCNIGKEGVYFNEMGAKPIITVKSDSLFIKTSNSIKNSALLIYEINISVNQSSKEIYISANQAANKSYKNVFKISLSDYKIDSQTSYKYFWLDPDQKSNELKLNL